MSNSFTITPTFKKSITPNATTFKKSKFRNINESAVTPNDTNAIISVNTHGMMDLNENNTTPFTFKVPKNVNLIIVSAVVPGVCNYAQQSDINKYNNIILDAIDIKPISKLVNTVLPNLNKALYNNYLDTTKKRKRDNIEMNQYFYLTTKNAIVSNYKSGDRVADKTFERKDMDLAQGSYDHRIPILNMYGKPDIMDDINYSTDTGEGSVISLSYIVKYCMDLGMNNIIIFDFSCSSFPIENPRTERNIRRRITTHKFGGRTNKTKRRQNKNTKTIKRSLKLKTKTRSKK
jgi:hypothetical protein